MRASARLTVFVLLVLAMASCGPAGIKDPVMETAIAILWTQHAETQIANTATQIAKTPTLTPTFLPPTAYPGTFPNPTPNPGQQVYIDPEGWYVVYFPADMKATDKANSFQGPSGYFETGYLSELGHTSALNVCTWLANVLLNPEESSMNWISYTNASCSVSASEGGRESTQYEVFENPAADPEHRFIYVKTVRRYNSVGFGASFSWLKPVYETKYNSDFQPLSPEEESFWETAISMPPNISVTEYKLPPEG